MKCVNCGTELAEDLSFCTNCGTPVAAADLPHTHEVLGNRAIYFDPYDEEDIYEGICRLVDDPVEAVASGNTWEDSSRRIKKVYRDAASEMC